MILQVDPVQVSAINFSRKRKCKQKVFKKSKLPSEEAYKTFLEAIEEHNPDAPYLEDLTDEEETSSASETEHQEENHLPNLIELLRTKFSGMLKHVRADHSIHSMLLDCSLLHETIQNIELSTRDQASSTMWNHQRKGRVTSSLFGKILRCKTGQKGLVEQIFGKSFSNAAIDWGKNQETAAKQQFLTYLSDQHVNGMLLPCGLLVDKENIFLGTTPDGLVMCDCCETALLEIKCPARGKGLVVEQIPRKNFFLDDSLNLKRNHVYFDQIQGQMDIWKLSRCYFVTSTDKNFHCQIIEFDENYWNLQKPLLGRFFQTYVLPEILINFYLLYVLINYFYFICNSLCCKNKKLFSLKDKS
ncbi:SWIM-type domain-containing protein [Trichonephila clavipes]|nr:SWIM-type domain-containing protein [Trichonephila clavipes]